jgi:aminoglycoside phosphotransferase
MGDSVHRPARPWTASVHAVLRHLEAAGFEEAPRVLGFDELGREVLSFVPGETVGERLPWPEWVSADQTLAQVGEWLRRLHDVMADFSPPDDAVWFSGRPWRPGLVVGHHDAAPYNAVWRDGRLVGFVDWDTAGPSSADFDLAYSALLWVPLVSAGSSWPLAFCAPDDRARRLHLLLDAYGWAGDRQSFGTVLATRARVNAQVIDSLASSGDPAYSAIHQQADDLESSAREIEALPASFWEPPGSA